MSDPSIEIPEGCPHCSGKLSKWLNPDDSSWGMGYQLVCFNDDCEYYQGGWKWMKEKYNMTASYRYRFNPVNGASGPLPVRSPKAGKDNLVDDSAEMA
jgi:hypothetical protein